MNRLFIFLAILILTTNVHSQDAGNAAGIQAITYADGILLEVDSPDIDLQVTIAGPANSSYTQKYPGVGPVFLDINDTNGQPLADGLYQYEVWPVPVTHYSREESSRMPDRNDISHKAGPKASSVSGSFRIVNGSIADSELIEYDANHPEGAVE